jgi:hypothetical protein
MTLASLAFSLQQPAPVKAVQAGVCFPDALTQSIKFDYHPQFPTNTYVGHSSTTIAAKAVTSDYDVYYSCSLSISGQIAAVYTPSIYRLSDSTLVFRLIQQFHTPSGWDYTITLRIDIEHYGQVAYRASMTSHADTSTPPTADVNKRSCRWWWTTGPFANTVHWCNTSSVYYGYVPGA